jgi:asparaginyl-tRNA synthetase
VSGQLNVETYCMAEQGLHLRADLPRRELQHPRHLAEFWMIEPEIAFADLADDADLAEAFLKSIFRTLLTSAPTTWRSSRSTSTRTCRSA